MPKSVLEWLHEEQKVMRLELTSMQKTVTAHDYTIHKLEKDLDALHKKNKHEEIRHNTDQAVEGLIGRLKKLFEFMAAYRYVVITLLFVVEVLRWGWKFLMQFTHWAFDYLAQQPPPRLPHP